MSTAAPNPNPEPRRSSNAIAFKLVGVVVLMVGLSFAAVPFYDWFCRVTGFGGTVSVADAAPGATSDEIVKIRFDASLEAGMPWTFKPEKTSMEVRFGEPALAYYIAHNPTDRPIAGTASYNVAPYEGGGYFTKVECFCFTEQVLQPGETVRMPVSFYVDPALLDDADSKDVRMITLSYTFHETPLPKAEAALAPRAATEAGLAPETETNQN